MRKICRRCGCGCGEITKPGNVYIQYHHWRGKKHIAETIKKMSEVKEGKKRSAETKLSISLGHMKHDPNSPYCEIWRDKEYRKDIRKDYCENVDCKKRLQAISQSPRPFG